MNNSGKTVLVTGASGFIGSSVAERFLRAKVRSLTRCAQTEKLVTSDSLQQVFGDLTDMEV